MTKQVNIVGDLDRIRSFPDHILCHILFFLPIKDAVRTSILSSRWRYLFTSMSILRFVENSGLGGPGEKFKKFVDRLLFTPNQLSLECFVLYDFDFDDCLCLNSWICAALRRGVKGLSLFTGESLMLQTASFNSQSLMILHLYTIGVIKIPTDVCLPNLKILELKAAEALDDSIFRLISSCAVLEEFHLESPLNISKLIIQNHSLKRLHLDLKITMEFPRDLNYAVEIDAPSLVNFDYSDLIAVRYNISNMKSLEKASILFYILDDVDHEPRVTQFLQAMCSVRTLDLFIVPPLTLFRKRLEPVLVFHNLVELMLYLSLWKGAWIVEFLHSVPNLKTLNLHLCVAVRGFEELPKEIPSCLSFHLKEIEVSDFKGGGHMFELIKYFLDNGTVLEKLKIGMKEESLFKEHQSSILEKLSKLPKKSKKCQVITSF